MSAETGAPPPEPASRRRSCGAEAAEALAAQTRADLAAERDRHDLGLAELRGQLTQLLARQPRTRRSTKAVTATADTAGKVDRATNTG